MPVWGVWLDGAFYFSTGPRSRKARNLAVNTHCVVCPEQAHEAVILEGIAEEASDPEVLARFKDAVRPRVAFAFIANAGESSGSPTRWRFPA